MSSLSLIDPELDRLIGAEVAADVALRAAEAAVSATGLSGPLVREALSAIRDRQVADWGSIRASVVRWAEELDQEYLDLYSGSGGELAPSVMRAFSVARAGAALAEALRPPSPESAGDALYEAHAALDERAAAQLLNQVRDQLERPQRRAGGASGA